MTRICSGAVAPALLNSVRARALALVLTACAAVLALPAGAQDTGSSASSSATPPATKHKAKPAGEAASGAGGSDKAQASYSIGLLMGAQLKQAGASKDSISYEQFSKGFRAALTGTAKPTPDDQKKAVGLIQQARAAEGSSNEAAAKQFLAENAKQPGVQTTASGLQYKVISPGNGQPPKPTDEVTVNYRGTLLDGTEFDSSFKRGQPASFPVNGVIKGWQEALVLMKPGSKYQLFIPPDLAYGANSPPPIPPNSLLKFDVELVSIKPVSAPPALGKLPGSPGAVGGAAPGGATPH